jgi:hypothetical protein
MKKEKVFLYYVTGEKEEVIVLVQRIQRDHHRFNGTTAQKVPELFVFPMISTTPVWILVSSKITFCLVLIRIKTG